MWDLNTQFPQTISKRRESKCSPTDLLKCTVSTLVHMVLYFQPCMFNCQPVHIICNVGYREEQHGDFRKERLSTEPLNVSALQSLESRALSLLICMSKSELH